MAGKGAEWGSHVMISDDFGESWDLGPNLPDGNECQVAELVDNQTLVINMRSRDKHRHFSWSQDYGETWSAPTTAPFEEYALGSDCQGSTIAVGNTLVFSTPFSEAGRDNMTLFM